jgi:hypothetical protein
MESDSVRFMAGPYTIFNSASDERLPRELLSLNFDDIEGKLV